MRYQLKSYEAGPRGDVIMKLEYQPGWLLRLFGVRPFTRSYVGGASVWRDYPSFNRCGTGTEMFLADVQAKVQFTEGK